MFFKKFSFYILEDNFNKEELENHLNDYTFTPISASQRASIGFVPIINNSKELVYQNNDTYRINFKKEEKILPSSVVNELLVNEVSILENTQYRKIGRKEKQELKGTIYDSLLPKAFSKSSNTEFIFDQARKLLLINQVSNNKLDEATSFLRKALGSLKIKIPNTKYDLNELMKEWLISSECYGNFNLSDNCEIIGKIDNVVSSAKFNKQNLYTEEIKSIAKNNEIKKLGLIWQDKISFTLDNEFKFSKIRFLDSMKESLNQDNEDYDTYFASTNLIMISSFGDLILELIESLGGLKY